MGDGTLGPDGPFCEHIRLALELAVFVQIFEGTEQIIRGIVLKEPPVFAVVEQAKFCGEGIVSGVQFGLLGGNVRLQEIFQLVGDQFIDDAPQLHHPLDPLLCVAAQLHWRHDRIFAVVNFAVHHRIGKILDVRVGGQNVRSALVQLGVHSLHCLISAVDMGHRAFKLFGQVGPLDRIDRHVLPAILGAFGRKFTQHHVRVIHKILVDGVTFGRLAYLHPLWFPVDGPLQLLQKEDIGNDFRPCIGFESVVGQPHRAQQVGPLGQVLAGSAVLGVHGETAGDKSHHAARPHLIKRFRKEIVVDGKAKVVVGFVVNLVVSKRHIAHGEVVEVPLAGGLKTCHCDIGFRVDLLSDTARDAVQFYAVQAAALH